MNTGMGCTTAPLSWKSVARVIEHTLLQPDATRAQVIQLCNEAAQFGFAAVCVQPCWTALAVAHLHLSPVKVASVVGFPHGATLTTAKRLEAIEILRLGADELDMVLNLGALKSGELAGVQSEIRAVVEVAHQAGALVKVILETALLSREEKVLACQLALAAGADFVKTSTGFSSAGATVDDVALLRATVKDRAGVKAAGGIRTASDVAAMLAAGADRIGTSSAIGILRELGALT
jgi:deoxyribose-phosphate aldolase